MTAMQLVLLRPQWWMHFQMICTSYKPATALLGVNPGTQHQFCGGFDKTWLGMVILVVLVFPTLTNLQL